MIVFTPILESEIKEKPLIPKYDGLKMSLEEFQNWEPEIEAGIKYEWNNGMLEATAKLKFNEQKMVDNLQNRFHKTISFQNGDRLLVEVECFLPRLNKIRIPDLCFLKKYQIDNCMKKETNQIPDFVMEIISKTNSGIEIAKKNNDYFDSGVKVVWNIYPELKEVMIHYSSKEIHKRIHNDICDVEKVIPDFQMPVDEIFK